MINGATCRIYLWTSYGLHITRIPHQAGSKPSIASHESPRTLILPVRINVLELIFASIILH